MIIDEGKFLLYSHITPALKAGDYRFEVSQSMTAKKGTQNIDAGAVPVEPLQTHVTVTAPRYQLPPDQVLSTYPPAGPRARTAAGSRRSSSNGGRFRGNGGCASPTDTAARPRSPKPPRGWHWSSSPRGRPSCD